MTAAVAAVILPLGLFRLRRLLRRRITRALPPSHLHGDQIEPVRVDMSHAIRRAERGLPGSERAGVRKEGGAERADHDARARDVRTSLSILGAGAGLGVDLARLSRARGAGGPAGALAAKPGDPGLDRAPWPGHRGLRSGGPGMDDSAGWLGRAVSRRSRARSADSFVARVGFSRRRPWSFWFPRTSSPAARSPPRGAPSRPWRSAGSSFWRSRSRSGRPWSGSARGARRSWTGAISSPPPATRGGPGSGIRILPTSTAHPSRTLDSPAAEHDGASVRLAGLDQPAAAGRGLDRPGALPAASLTRRSRIQLHGQAAGQRRNRDPGCFA